MTVPITDMLRPDQVEIRTGHLQVDTALITIDLEGDYNGPHRRGLERVNELLELMVAENIPLTVYVEGRLFEQCPDVCNILIQAGADVQLHCYDHTQPGDTRESLRRGISAYEDFMARKPSGYRAHSFRLTTEIYQVLLEENFVWDSSVLPSFGLGGNTSWTGGGGDWYLLDDSLYEFPVATWGRFSLPLTHSYRRLIKKPFEMLLRYTCRLPRLLVYDMHMVDLVWTGSLSTAPVSPFLKTGWWLCWGFNRGDSFDDLRGFLRFLRERGYHFSNMSNLCQELAKGV